MNGEAEEIIAVVPDAPWLPPGGRAEIVRSSEPPSPTGLVRLLVRDGDRIFCEPRSDSGKLDLPTEPAPADDLEGCSTAEALTRRVLGASNTPIPVGFVRNVVEAATAGYPWPTPLAHFTVWTVVGSPIVPGTWVDTSTDDNPLQDRHWWPITREAI